MSNKSTDPKYRQNNSCKKNPLFPKENSSQILERRFFLRRSFLQASSQIIILNFLQLFFPRIGHTGGIFPFGFFKKSINEPKLLVFYVSGGPILVLDAKLNNVTSTYVPSQPAFSAAASYEQLVMPPNQKKYLGFGTYANGAAVKGCVADISATPWIFYSDYAGITVDGSGNSFVRHMAPNVDGYAAGWAAGTEDEAVCNITSKAEAGGYPVQFTTGTNYAMKVYGNYLYKWSSAGLSKFTFTNSSLTHVSSNGTYVGGAYGSIAVNSSGSMITAGDTRYVYFYDNNLVHQRTLDMNSNGLTCYECMEFSPDDRYLLIGGQSSAGANGKVLIVDTVNSYTVSVMTVPAGGTNDRFTGCSWYPDSDRYLLSGYVGAKTHIGKRSAGGLLTNLSQAPYNIGTTYGVAVVS